MGFSLGCKFRAGRVMSLLAGGRLPLPFFPQNSRERDRFSEDQYVKELVCSQSSNKEPNSQQFFGLALLLPQEVF